MSIRSKFSSLGYLYPKYKQVELTISCNVSADKIYLNDEVIATNVMSTRITVNQGKICKVKVEKDDYNTYYSDEFVIYKNEILNPNLTIATKETLYLTVNSGSDGSFIIPTNQFRKVAYNWNVDWGDGSGWKNYIGTGATNSGVSYYNYKPNQMYTIKIKNGGTTPGWLMAFGFDTTNSTGSASLDNKNKLRLIDGEMSQSMFYPSDYKPSEWQTTNYAKYHYMFAYMFNDCRNLQIGESFNLPQDILYGVAGNHYSFQYMFYNCTGLKSLKNMTLPQNLIYGGYSFCVGMFYNCTSLEDLGNFNLPQNLVDTGNKYINDGYGGRGGGAFKSMFYGCTKLKSLGNLQCSNTITKVFNDDFDSMFENCASLNDTANFNFPQKINDLPLTYFAYCTFKNCTSLESLGNITMPNVTSINGNSIPNIGNYSTSSFGSKPTNLPTWYRFPFEETFSGCTALKTGIVNFFSNWTNATEFMINFHIAFREYYGSWWSDRNYNYDLFKMTFYNCTSLQEQITTSIKCFSFTPYTGLYTDNRQTFHNCSQENVSSLPGIYRG